MRLLLTAFDPFGGESVNPAEEAVKKVSDIIGDIEIIKCFVPTVFYKSFETVKKAIEEYRPDMVLCIGQAGGREGITVERVAINIDDARIPDNEGNQPVDNVIFKDGENAYFCTLPVKKMVSAIQKAGLAASLSSTAGTFVCNHLLYSVLYYIDRELPGTRAGFIHVPYVPKQVKDKKTPSMPLESIVKGIEEAIRSLSDAF